MSRVIKPTLGELLDTRYRQHPRYLNCVGHWIMSEGGGATLYDISGNAHHGSFTNAPTWTSGPMGRALNYNGTSNYIETVASPHFSPYGDGSVKAQLTLTAWATPATTAQTYLQLLGKGASGNYEYMLGFNAASLQVAFQTFSLDGSQYYYNASSTVAASAVRPNLIVGVLDYIPGGGGSATIYLNGVQVGIDTTNVAATMATGTVPLRIGIREGGANWYKGIAHEVRIYNRALTLGEIVSLYQEPFLEFEEEAIVSPASFDFAGQRRRSSASRILQPYNLCEPFPGAP